MFNIQVVPNAEEGNAQVSTMLQRHMQIEQLSQAATVAVQEKLNDLTAQLGVASDQFVVLETDTDAALTAVQKYLQNNRRTFVQNKSLLLTAQRVDMVKNVLCKFSWISAGVKHEETEKVDTLCLKIHSVNDHVFNKGRHSATTFPEELYSSFIETKAIPVCVDQHTLDYLIMDDELIALVTILRNCMAERNQKETEIRALEEQKSKVEKGASVVTNSMLRASLESSAEGNALLEAARSALASAVN